MTRKKTAGDAADEEARPRTAQAIAQPRKNAAIWTAKAAETLLRLRFRTLSERFEAKDPRQRQTAWELLAAETSGVGGLQVTGRQCKSKLKHMKKLFTTYRAALKDANAKAHEPPYYSVMCEVWGAEDEQKDRQNGRNDAQSDREEDQHLSPRHWFDNDEDEEDPEEEADERDEDDSQNGQSGDEGDRIVRRDSRRETEAEESKENRHQEDARQEEEADQGISDGDARENGAQRELGNEQRGQEDVERGRDDEDRRTGQEGGQRSGGPSRKRPREEAEAEGLHAIADGLNNIAEAIRARGSGSDSSISEMASAMKDLTQTVLAQTQVLNNLVLFVANKSNNPPSRPN